MDRVTFKIRRWRSAETLDTVDLLTDDEQSLCLEDSFASLTGPRDDVSFSSWGTLNIDDDESVSHIVKMPSPPTLQKSSAEKPRRRQSRKQDKAPVKPNKTRQDRAPKRPTKSKQDKTPKRPSRPALQQSAKGSRNLAVVRKEVDLNDSFAQLDLDNGSVQRILNKPLNDGPVNHFSNHCRALPSLLGGNDNDDFSTGSAEELFECPPPSIFKARAA